MLLINADFYESELKHSEIINCKLNEANFSNVLMESIDLSVNHFEGITVSLDKLRGCRVTSAQALSFARALGVVISEEN